jgi:hypothetical protein
MSCLGSASVAGVLRTIRTSGLSVAFANCCFHALWALLQSFIYRNLIHITGDLRQMKKGDNSKRLRTISLLLFLVLICFTLEFSSAQSTQLYWTKRIGWNNDQALGSLVQTGNGDLVAVGTTFSSNNDNTGQILLVKVDNHGNLIWNKTYGQQSVLDFGNAIINTVDECFAVTGYVNSYGSKGADFLLAKYDTEGNELWRKTYGGSDYDYGMCLVQTGDGGFVMVGATYSYGAGMEDLWLVRTDSSGNKVWSNTYGGLKDDSCDTTSGLIQTSDGGFAFVGSTESYGTGKDIFLVKVDANGGLEWNKTFGGRPYASVGYSLAQSADGGYFLAGKTYLEKPVAWLIKTDENGTALWDKTYGDGYENCARSVVLTSDGGCALAGYTTSVSSNEFDFWVFKTDLNGNLEWQSTFGDINTDDAWCVIETTGGGFAACGFITPSGTDYMDGFLVKTDSLGAISPTPTPSPTPTLSPLTSPSATPTPTHPITAAPTSSLTTQPAQSGSKPLFFSFSTDTLYVFVLVAAIAVAFVLIAFVILRRRNKPPLPPPPFP